MTILNSNFFYSVDSQSTVASNSTKSVVLPKMLSSSDFSVIFTGLAESTTDAAKLSLVASFLVNVVLSGPMDLLWCLINSLQIVTQYPLINVMMPSNAYQLILTIVQISEFQLIPVEETIERMEQGLGIQNDGLAISQNFIDFELDSTDVIRNLQIVFLFMVALIALPLVLLLLFNLFNWSARCKMWLNRIAKAVFWNTYIRFALESYLEFCIASLLRLRQLNFHSSSEVFNSLLALLIFLSLVAFLVGSVLILHWKSAKSYFDGNKFSELSLGLRKS